MKALRNLIFIVIITGIRIIISLAIKTSQRTQIDS